MRKGSKHEEASPTADKIIFSKVADANTESPDYATASITSPIRFLN